METLKHLVLHRYWHRTGGMLGFAILLGIAGGVAAALFKATLDTVQYWVLERFSGFPVPGVHAQMLPEYLFFLVPAVGGLVAHIRDEGGCRGSRVKIFDGTKTGMPASKILRRSGPSGHGEWGPGQNRGAVDIGQDPI